MMSYDRYEEDIVLRYGIVLQGWTYEKILNPSLMSSSLPLLMALRDALIAGTCKFVKLTAAERKEIEVTYMAKIKSGEVEARKRKQRSDTGTRKKKRARSEVDAVDDSGDKDNGAQVPKGPELIEDSDDNGNTSD